MQEKKTREKTQKAERPPGKPRKTEQKEEGGSAPTRSLLDLIRLIHLVSFLHRDELTSSTRHAERRSRIKTGVTTGERASTLIKSTCRIG
jgi:hypothetical protein